MAKALIMLVRLLGLGAIVLGALLWSGNIPSYPAHIAAGFLIAICIFTLSIWAMTKKAIVPGAIGLVMACLLPVTGFMQLPLTYHTLRGIQAAHVVITLCTIGLAERLYSAVRAR